MHLTGMKSTTGINKNLELVRKHCQEKWILMYIDRCLKAPILMPDKTLKERNAGTPQGGVISPVLANLFMHYAFDSWMNYFCKFTPSEAFQKGINYVNQKLVRWIRKMKKKAKRSSRKAQILLKRIALSNPKMFYQWQDVYMPM